MGKPRGNNFSNSVAEKKFKLSVSVVYFDQGTGASLFQHLKYVPVINGTRQVYNLFQNLWNKVLGFFRKVLFKKRCKNVLKSSFIRGKF